MFTSFLLPFFADISIIKEGYLKRRLKSLISSSQTAGDLEVVVSFNYLPSILSQ